MLPLSYHLGLEKDEKFNYIDTHDLTSRQETYRNALAADP